MRFMHCGKHVQRKRLGAGAGVCPVFSTGHCLLAGYLLLASGCYAAAVGTALGIAAANKGEGSASRNDPPVISFIEVPSRVNGDFVHVEYSVLDDRDGTVRVAIEWQDMTAGDPEPDEDRPYFVATPGPLAARSLQGEDFQAEDATAINTSRGDPRQAAFIWSARDDLQARLGRQVNRVRLRMRAFSNGQEGRPSLSRTFWAGNEIPRIGCVDATTCIRAVATSGVIPLELSLSDSSGDRVRVHGKFRVRDGEEKPIHLLGLDVDAATDAPASGAAKTIFWDSVTDFPGQASEEVYLSITPEDDLDVSGSGSGAQLFGPFSVDNNSDPVVRLVDVAGPPGLPWET